MNFPAFSDVIHAIPSLAFIQDRVQRERTMRLYRSYIYPSVADMSAKIMSIAESTMLSSVTLSRPAHNFIVTRPKIENVEDMTLQELCQDTLPQRMLQVVLGLCMSTASSRVFTLRPPCRSSTSAVSFVPMSSSVLNKGPYLNDV